MSEEMNADSTSGTLLAPSGREMSSSEAKAKHELETARERFDSLYDNVITAYEDEYKDINETWRSIETKAQGTVAIAGIFAAGAFAFTRELLVNVNPTQRWLHVLTMAFLISSVIMAVWALFVRRTSGAPLGESMENIVRDLVLNDVPESELPQRLNNLQKEQAARWRSVNAELTTSNVTKGRLLRISQCLLVLAIITIGALTITIVLTSRPTPVTQEKAR